MAQTSLMPPIKTQFFDSNGNPAAGGKVYTWMAGTNNTAKASYTDSTGDTANANPVVLDSAGMAAIWLSGYYHIQAYDAAGNLIADADNVSSMPNTVLTQSQWVSQNITLTYVDGDNFTTPGTLTTTFEAGLRVKATVSAGDIYGTVASSTAGGTPVVTTVTVTWDSGQLDSGLSALWTGIITPTNCALPGGADLTKLHAMSRLYLGYLQRSKFTWTDADTITIGPGVYHHSGTTDQIVYWTSDLTFDSTDTGSQWYYLYIDDSAIVTAGTNVLTASEFVCSTTGPTWSDAKLGWYNGEDRCIFAYYVSSGSILRFTHDGGCSVQYINSFIDLSAFDITARTAVILTIPSFCTKAVCYILCSLNDTYFLYTAPADANGVVVCVGKGGEHRTVVVDVMTSDDQKLYISLNDYTGTNLITVLTNSWYFPRGM